MGCGLVELVELDRIQRPDYIHHFDPAGYMLHPGLEGHTRHNLQLVARTLPLHIRDLLLRISRRPAFHTRPRSGRPIPDH